MKKILLSLLLVSGCSGIEVFSTGHFMDLSKTDLKEKSKELFKESHVENYGPPSDERNAYYSSLESNKAYRQYLFVECAMLLNKEHNLDYNQRVYASLPRWNNVQNWYSSIFNFHTTNKKDPEVVTMECDLALNNKNEVSEYQLKKSYIQLIKTE